MAEEKVAHQGEISIHAIVYKQMPNGLFSPEAVWSEGLSIKFRGDSAQECIEELKRKIGALKDHETG